MKKTRLFAIAGLFAAGLAFGQSVTVTAPNGGECWDLGATQAITWTSSGCSGNVRINLVKAGGGVFGTIAVVPVAGGSYVWNVGQTNAGTAPAGDYRIGLYVSTQDVDDQSNAAFSIISPAIGLSIQSPSGGESWELGSSKKIQWLASNVPVNCRLVLLKDGVVKGTIRDSFAPGQGENIWNWVVGNYLGGTAPAGSGYKVRMELIDGSFHAQSAAPFAITPVPIILAPLGKIEVQQIFVGRPDLVVCLAWKGTIPNIYQDRRISVRIKNVGPGSAPAGNFKIYVEGHGDQLVQVPALAPQGEYSWSKKYDWKTCGHKTVRVTADPDGLIAENNENNNMLQGTIKVSCGESGYLLQMDRCSDQN